MIHQFFQTSKVLLLIITVFFTGCATREDFNRSFIERFVREGVYVNELKGFRMDWPDTEIWQFKNYPEFDLSFDHQDGRSQVVVVGVNSLIRRDFPNGFEAWLLDRLNASDIQRSSHKEFTSQKIEKFRIVSDCVFNLDFGETFGIKRKTDMMLIQKENQWVAVICICPPESYDEKVPLFNEILDSVEML